MADGGAVNGVAELLEQRRRVERDQRIVVDGEDRKLLPDDMSGGVLCLFRHRDRLTSAQPADRVRRSSPGPACFSGQVCRRIVRPCHGPSDSPRPVPLPTPLVVKNGSMARCERLLVHAFAGVGDGDADIASRFRPVHFGLGVRSRAEMMIEPPFGIASRAFTARLSSASSSWLASACTCGKLEREVAFRSATEGRASFAADPSSRARARARRRVRARAPAAARRPACAGSALRRAGRPASRCRSVR